MITRAYNFCAGPATLPEPVLQEAQSELLNWNGYGASVLEMGHRSAEVEALMAETEQRFRDVLSIPDNYSLIMIGGSGRSNFGMIPLNFLNQKSSGAYIVSGIWSKMAYEEAKKLMSATIVASSEENNHRALPDLSSQAIPEQASYLYYTSNETVNGTQFTHPPIANKPLVCDMTSSLLSEAIDFDRYGLIFAGAQKNIAQAGMSVVIISNTFLETIDPEAIIPTMMDYRVHVKSRSLYATPPVFNCYIANKVLQWLEKNGGISAFEERNLRKSKKLYDFIDNSSFYACNIDAPSRSVMNVCFEIADASLDSAFVEQSEKNGLLALKGHRAVGGMRASIYNAMPEEGVDALISFMQKFEKENSQ